MYTHVLICVVQVGRICKGGCKLTIIIVESLHVFNGITLCWICMQGGGRGGSTNCNIIDLCLFTGGKERGRLG